MKTLLILLASVAIAFGQAPPIQRNAFTTNGQVAANAAVRAAVPTNNPIFQGTAVFGGTVDVTGAATFNNTVTASGGFFALGNNPFQISNGAGDGKIFTSDSSGLGTWQTAVVPYSSFGSYAVDDFSSYTLGTTNFSLSGGYGWGTNVGRMDRGTNYTARSTNTAGQISTVLQIRNGGFTRRMPWASDWMRIRIALLWRFPTNEISTNNFTGAFYLGVCNSTNGFPTNPPTSSLTNVPVWWGVGDSATASIFEYKATASSFQTYLGGVSSQVRWRFLQVTNNNSTVVSPSGGSSLAIARDAGQFSWVILNLARSVVTNAAWSSGFGAPNNTQITFHQPNIAIAENILRGDVTTTRTGVPTGYDLTAGTDATIAIDPALYGPIDSINFAWVRPGTNAVELAGYAVMKLQ